MNISKFIFLLLVLISNILYPAARIFTDENIEASSKILTQHDIALFKLLFENKNIAKILIDLLACRKHSYWQEHDITDKAIIIVPVADMATKSLQFIDPAKPAQEIYDSQPFSPESGTNSCCRANQLLFNEILTLIQKKGDEVECQCSNVFYETESREKVSSFWTHNKNIRLLKDIEDLSAIPAPYNESNTVLLDNILTLTMPFSDSNSNTYSAGSRFVRTSSLDTEDHYAVKAFNYNLSKTEILFIPKNQAIVSYPTSEEDKRNLFVYLAKKWAHLASKIIPYVWGGRSFTCSCDTNNFMLIKTQRGDDNISYWIRTIDTKPCSGFDCSGLILRLCQILGIPYFYNNTTTLANNLKPLAEGDVIKAGDLIWFPGHVMLISNIEEGTLIEASGYTSKFARTHERRLCNTFKDINTITQLTESYRNKTALNLLDAEQKVVKKIGSFLILKLF